MAINEYVFKPLSQYLLKKEINSVFTLCSSNEDGVIGQPDFAFFHNDIVKLVIEVKTIWSLTAPDNLAADYRISGPQVRLPVEQIFGYMRINNLKYGILTNYESFYFMKREKMLLHISTAIKSTDVDLSVYRALFYIIHLSIEDHLCSPNTSVNDDKTYDSDQDEIKGDEEDHESEEDNDNDDVYSPKRKKKRSEQYQSSKSKQIKLMNEAIGYGQNGCVFKCLYNNTEYATKICDTTKNTNDVYIFCLRRFNGSLDYFIIIDSLIPKKHQTIHRNRIDDYIKYLDEHDSSIYVPVCSNIFKMENIPPDLLFSMIHPLPTCPADELALILNHTRNFIFD
ncbi:unnamed protein product [Rotaria socialis]|uniref:Uncharacterized protein n=2 Tax=Rotaria socialis TaxID=392032 RepID=A0A818S1I2_9BILA|nr:unnamed protein product [Rotaria socialis]